MSTLELNLFTVLKTELQLSDQKAMHIVQAFEKSQKENIKVSINEFKSEFKDDFHRLDLKIEQFNSKIENVRGEIKESKSDTLKWFMGGFITLVLMILGLFATILLK